MKQISPKYIASGLLALALCQNMQSCNYLDKKPDNLLTSDMVWETRANAESYLNQIYSYIETPVDDFTTLGASDETSCNIPVVNVRQMAVGNWNAQSMYWQHY
ncbi:hypothetical protein KUH03_35445 [Sphingobacterium sp. E70]|nr:hypothetical protein [Sphingobacterium sp. E70]ULT24270.1 hypothetical protein KUH03_35445 [Sphingobacterium sp. E70]